MLCKKPYNSGSGFHGCGQCFPCRVSQRRLLTHRILLESYDFSHSAFVTLTYSDEALKSPWLQKRHYQLFLKSLRKALYPQKIRYYVVGEYGDQSWRPHFHLILFNYMSCLYGRSTYSKSRRSCCPQCDLVRDCWGRGQVDLGEVNKDSAQYAAQYLQKKLSLRTLPKLPVPEFAKWSKGLGGCVVSPLAEALTSDSGVDEIIRSGDVPMSLRHGSKQMPLGRYLRGKLRAHLGFKEKGTPKILLLAAQMQMRDMFREELKKPQNRSKQLSQIIVDVNKQKALNLESKSKLFNKRKGL